MRKNAFTIVEVVVVFLLILAVTFFILPISLDNTKQARFISKWTAAYSKLEYMFQVIKAQKESEIKQRFHTAQNNNDRKDIIIETLKPYLRITSKARPDYKQYYMNGAPVAPGGRYYFDTFYLTSSNEIIGLKWLNANCQKNEVCAVLTFDVNGPEKPNTWGYDIFGINILRDNIEPVGKNLEPGLLKDDCTKYGFGVYCSYYYLIGGKFD